MDYDFLSQRTQAILLDGHTSSALDVHSEVIGPLLFLTYINDLSECTNSECLSMTAWSIDGSEAREMQPNYRKISQPWEDGNTVGRRVEPGKVHSYPNREQKIAVANILYSARTLARSCGEWKVF